MKNIITFLILGLFTLVVSAQGYTVSQSIGTEEDYVYYSPGTTVLTVPSNDVLSSVQNIPFSWSYYGAPVTSYKVSDNGYITFDVNATISEAANTIIPSVGGPNKAIYAFWDDLNLVSGTGTVDKVRTFNYGVAPNRTHVIQWYSVTPVNGTGYIYASIRIHECGDFDIVYDFGNASGMSATVGCEDVTGFNGTMVEGPSFSYPNGSSVSTDDIVYTFFWDDIDYDATVKSLDLGRFVSVGTNTISGSFINQGAQEITSYDLNYSVDGGSAVTMNVSGVSIAAFGGIENYNHSTPLSIANGGELHAVCVWVDNINGNIDERTCNDTLCVDVFSINGISASKVNVVLEQFTGSWAGWCIDGQVISEGIVAQYPDNVFSVAIHEGDGMEFEDDIRSEFDVSSYPSGMINRKVFDGEEDELISRGIWAAKVGAQLTRYTPLEVGVSHSYDSLTRTITATVSAEFVDFASGDMRFVLEIIEDSVVGTGSGYDQVNALNTTVGHEYEGAGDPIVGHVHRRVLRANLPGVFGNVGIIPSIASPGEIYSENFTYEIPIDYDETKISLLGFVSYTSSIVGQREIVNSEQEKLDLTQAYSSLEEDDFIETFSLSPNPVENQLLLELNFRNKITADIVIYNTTGQIVKRQGSKIYTGNQKINWSTEDLTSGVYYVTVQTENKAITKKMVVK